MNTTPPLEPRFQEPPGWRWHAYRHNGRDLRFGSALPASGKPDAHIVCLPGLSEFSEKYFETARECLSRNLAFWTLDWFGQGGSGRYFKHSAKRHSDDFRRDLEDIDALVSDFVRAPDVPAAPMAMLAHSMGAHMGLRYIEEHPHTFVCAGFSAPMWGIKAFENIPDWMAGLATGLMRNLAATGYAPGEGDWDAAGRTNDGPLALSTDPVRVRLHNAWCEAKPALRSAGATYGWVYEAVESCRALARPEALSKVKIPVVTAIAGQERLVDNRKARAILRALPSAKILEFPEARHEIFMERDAIRGAFFTNFYEVLAQNINRPDA